MAPVDGGAVLDDRFRAVDGVFALSVRWVALASACWTLPALGAEVPLSSNSRVRFADVRDGVAALTQHDTYLEQLSPFDYQVRIKTDRPVGEADLLAHIPPHVRPWTTEEIARLTPVLESLAKKLAPWKLSLPPEILLVKTDGHEDAGAAYTRGTTIVLPQRMVDGTRKSLDKLLPHELFHVLSRNNPELRDQLYTAIGFGQCNEISLPGALKARRITNPDAPVNDRFITVKLNGRTVELMPVLFSKTAQYEPARGGTLFEYLTFKLMELTDEGADRRPQLVNGQPVLYDPAQVPGFYEQVGHNTDYIIHPEEILADNFVFLLNGQINLPSPHVVQRMGKIIQAAAEKRELEPAGVQ